MLAAESSARNRLDNFRDGVKKYQGERPEVLGATVYGSMIKGEQAKENSDVDAFLYIDKDVIPETGKRKDLDVLESEYRSDFLKKLGVSEDEAKKYYGDLRTQILDNEVLSTEIASRVEYENEQREHKEMLNRKYSFASPEEQERLLSQEPAFRQISFPISGMFHAKIGKGIEKYRRLFLEKINDLQDKSAAESIWNDVYSQLKTLESRSDPTKEIKMPATLEEAIRTYHPDLHKKMQSEKDKTKISELRERLQNSYDKSKDAV